MTSGGKWWRLKYRFGGKEKRLSLGVYPDVSLHAGRIIRRLERDIFPWIGGRPVADVTAPELLKESFPFTSGKPTAGVFQVEAVLVVLFPAGDQICVNH